MKRSLVETKSKLAILIFTLILAIAPEAIAKSNSSKSKSKKVKTTKPKNEKLQSKSPSCEIQIKGKKTNLNQLASSQEQVFELLETTPQGRQTVASIIFQLRVNKLEIKPMTDIVRKTYGLTKTAQALYTYDVVPHVLYLDYKKELGSVALDAFHEFIHVLNENDIGCRNNIDNTIRLANLEIDEIIAGAQRRVNRAITSEKDNAIFPEEREKIKKLKTEMEIQNQRCIFNSERKAFDEEYKIIETMDKTHKCYRAYSAAQTSDFQRIGHKITDDKIIQLYRLDSKIIKDSYYVNPKAAAPAKR